MYFLLGSAGRGGLREAQRVAGMCHGECSIAGHLIRYSLVCGAIVLGCVKYLIG